MVFRKIENLTTKICSKCGVEKEIDRFRKSKGGKHNKKSLCKECIKEYAKLYYLNNLEKAKLVSYLWRENHKEQHLENAKKWRKANSDKIRDYKIFWSEKNPEKAKRMRQNIILKSRSSPKGKLNHRISVAIRSSLNKTKNYKHWETLVGYSLDQLKKHLEKQFTEGMTWKNYGSVWHIDHRIPVSAFNFKFSDDMDFKRCWELNNLRPLGATENIKKGNKMIDNFQPSFCFN